MKVQYNGDLRCTATHIKSGNQVITDAPTDNNGKGEAFSPTDLLCTSLSTCMMTLMGIAANSKEIQLGQIDADIEKIMGSDPRRVSGINIQFRIQSLLSNSLRSNLSQLVPKVRNLPCRIQF